ncbi:MAG: toll/interleukin-1 receptor domain-containing protein [Proteobacteria bacterium]|nr:toll/interleukin-1 receptor domain-containing protein [Pseudomonadota bacterium]
MVAPAPEPAQDEEAATAAAVQVSETVAVDETSRHAFDLFVSYASEDRSIVEELVGVLEKRNLKVWWDKGQITLGDRLSAKIDEGLRSSRYGVVIISHSFIAKNWPENELRSMINRSISKDEKVILPVLVGLTHDQIAAHYPLITDTVTTVFDGNFNRLADEITAAIRHG